MQRSSGLPNRHVCLNPRLLYMDMFFGAYVRRKNYCNARFQYLNPVERRKYQRSFHKRALTIAVGRRKWNRRIGYLPVAGSALNTYRNRIHLSVKRDQKGTTPWCIRVKRRSDRAAALSRKKSAIKTEKLTKTTRTAVTNAPTSWAALMTPSLTLIAPEPFRGVNSVINTETCTHQPSGVSQL